MSSNNAPVEIAQENQEVTSKQLSKEDRLLVENLMLKTALSEEKLSSAQRELASLKAQLQRFLASIQNTYFPGSTEATLDLKEGIISLASPKQEDIPQTD